jgi:hypothetical protein
MIISSEGGKRSLLFLSYYVYQKKPNYLNLMNFYVTFSDVQKGPGVNVKKLLNFALDVLLR